MKHLFIVLITISLTLISYAASANLQPFTQSVLDEHDEIPIFSALADNDLQTFTHIKVNIPAGWSAKEENNFVRIESDDALLAIYVQPKGEEALENLTTDLKSIVEISGDLNFSPTNYVYLYKLNLPSAYLGMFFTSALDRRMSDEEFCVIIVNKKGSVIFSTTYESITFINAPTSKNNNSAPAEIINFVNHNFIPDNTMGRKEEIALVALAAGGCYTGFGCLSFLILFPVFKLYKKK